jgi:hypothetical protein
MKTEALTPEQAGQVAAGLNVILGRLGYPDHELSDWWNHVSWPQLAGRTATQAWLAGAYDDVAVLIEQLYLDAQESVARTTADVAFMASLRKRAQRLREAHASGPTGYLGIR